MKLNAIFCDSIYHNLDNPPEGVELIDITPWRKNGLSGERRDIVFEYDGKRYLFTVHKEFIQKTSTYVTLATAAKPAIKRLKITSEWLPYDNT